MRRVLVEPVGRIEGHARVTLRVDGDGRAVDARVEVLELRAFEALCVGRPLREMPALTARICGICPVAHAHAAAEAGDEILGAEPPPAARALRRLLLLGSLVQSHATSFFLLAAPELALEADAPPEARNALALAEAAPALVRDGVALRAFGGQVVERVAGRRVHPAFAVPGGVTHPLDPAARSALAAALPAALDAAARTVSWWLERAPARADPPPGRGVLLAHVGPAGELALAGGALRVASTSGAILEDRLAPADALGRIVERPLPWSYAKLCAWRDPAGRTHAYEVGPVARLAAAARCGTPRADEALRAVSRGGRRAALDRHAARLVELLAALEQIEALLADPALASREVLAPPAVFRAEGAGACEAPRGALFHRYRVDGQGRVAELRIVAPTGQNARAMNAAIRGVARRAGGGERITPALRSGVEAALRAFDPCLSCATHTFGAPAASLRLVGPGGELLDEA